MGELTATLPPGIKRLDELSKIKPALHPVDAEQLQGAELRLRAVLAQNKEAGRLVAGVSSADAEIISRNASQQTRQALGKSVGVDTNSEMFGTLSQRGQCGFAADVTHHALNDLGVTTNSIHMRHLRSDEGVGLKRRASGRIKSSSHWHTPNTISSSIRRLPLPLRNLQPIICNRQEPPCIMCITR